MKRDCPESKISRTVSFLFPVCFFISVLPQRMLVGNIRHTPAWLLSFRKFLPDGLSLKIQDVAVLLKYVAGKIEPATGLKRICKAYRSPVGRWHLP